MELAIVQLLVLSDGILTRSGYADFSHPFTFNCCTLCYLAAETNYVFRDGDSQIQSKERKGNFSSKTRNKISKPIVRKSVEILF